MKFKLKIMKTSLKPIFKNKSINIDTRKTLNRGDKQIPDSVLEQEENSYTIEFLESLNVPIFKYLTQITLHGFFPKSVQSRIDGYKSIFLNGNQSLGIKYIAIDNKKFNFICECINLVKSNIYYVKNSSERFFCKIFKLEDREQAQQFLNSIPNCFVGNKYGMISELEHKIYIYITFNSIYQKDIYEFISFLTDNQIQNEFDYNKFINEYNEKQKELAEKNNLIAQEKKLEQQKIQKEYNEFVENMISEFSQKKYLSKNFNKNKEFILVRVLTNEEYDLIFNYVLLVLNKDNKYTIYKTDEKTINKLNLNIKIDKRNKSYVTHNYNDIENKLNNFTYYILNK